MAKGSHFGPELFRFLKQLKRNNDRDWFQKNKYLFEAHVRDPMLQFIADFAPKLNKISPRFLAIPHPVKGSLFRIHRDTRFSRDKSPYKTWAAAQFRHVSGKDVHAPCFYLHLEPGRVFAGMGLWHPDGRALRSIRGAIMENQNEWRRILSAKTFKAACTLEGESLMKAPRGIDPDHPLIEDLKRKDFVTVAAFTDKQACAPDFLDRFVKSCRTASPFVEFLTRAVGLPF